MPRTKRKVKLFIKKKNNAQNNYEIIPSQIF